jgi:hypothetical protein
MSVFFVTQIIVVLASPIYKIPLQCVLHALLATILTATTIALPVQLSFPNALPVQLAIYWLIALVVQLAIILVLIM